ncbi:uracil-DNA glycosylase family protein [Desulforhopalus sp. IMCC35007]|nr:uracil-DNA glycosylase family protein [Desulforhopalus sp. IMCC35007]
MQAAPEFFHQHPYEIFIPAGTTKIIVGTLPPPRFSLGRLKEKDVNFCYGSCDGMLWPVLDTIFNLSLHYDNSEGAVNERKTFLRHERLGICDIVESCKRKKIDASDLGMYDITLRDILLQLEKHQDLTTIIFTGGNSKNGPEYFFRQQLRAQNLSLKPHNNDIPRKHTFYYAGKEIKTIALTSPSNAANRAIGSTAHYKKQKAANPAYTTFDFRVEQYKKVFIP